jgi:hypothetical protein
LRDLILEQAIINDNIAKRLTFNDKILEGISAKMDSFSSVVKEQMILNKKDGVAINLVSFCYACCH